MLGRAAVKTTRIFFSVVLPAVLFYFALANNVVLLGSTAAGSVLNGNEYFLKYGSDCLADITDTFDVICNYSPDHPQNETIREYIPASTYLTSIDFSKSCFHIIKNDSALFLKTNIIINLRI